MATLVGPDVGLSLIAMRALQASYRLPACLAPFLLVFVVVTDEASLRLSRRADR